MSVHVPTCTCTTPFWLYGGFPTYLPICTYVLYILAFSPRNIEVAYSLPMINIMQWFLRICYKGISPMLLMYFQVLHALVFHVGTTPFCNIFCFLAWVGAEMLHHLFIIAHAIKKVASDVAWTCALWCFPLR
jgi:hypothetical protein